MANVIQIKRGSGAPTASNLIDGELGFDKTNNVLYIGKDGIGVVGFIDWNKIAATYLPLSGGTLTGLLKINTNGITTTFGSQNENWVHIYNNGSKPFIFNNTVATTTGDLGTSTYQFNNTYIKGTLYLSKIQDASGIANNNPALIIGGATTDQHIEIDSNEILAKTNGTTPGVLWLQDGTGTVKTGGTGGFTVDKGSMSITSGNLTLSSGTITVSSGNINVNAGNISAGTNGNTDAERRVYVQSGAGQMYLYSQASTSGTRGIWLPAHGSGSAKSAFSVDTNNNVTFNGTLSGNASTATSARYLSSIATIGSGTSDHATALKNYFNSNKASINRNVLINFYDTCSGNGSLDMGYFLNGYDDGPYGGFFCAHYNNAYYVGIAGGTYTNQRILTSSNYNDYMKIRYSSSAPSSPSSGTIWLKPI